MTTQTCRWFSRSVLCGLLAIAACGDDALDSPEGAPDGGISGATPDAGGFVEGGPIVTFRKDGVLLDLTGANDASYHQQTNGGWRLFVVVKDVAGDRYLSLDITSTDGEVVGERPYDCSMLTDAAARGRARITFREGAGADEKQWRQSEGSPCLITVSEIGEVGGRMVGTFSGTLLPLGDRGGPAIVLTEGAFDVERHQF